MGLVMGLGKLFYNFVFNYKMIGLTIYFLASVKALKYNDLVNYICQPFGLQLGTFQCLNMPMDWLNEDMDKTRFWRTVAAVYLLKQHSVLLLVQGAYTWIPYKFESLVN